MSSFAARLAVGFLAIALGCAFPSSAAAQPDIGGSPEGKSYFTIVFFADFLNGDCFKFEDDGAFIASFGLLTGEWTEEEYSILFFSLTYFEVELESPENPVFTLVSLLDGKVIAGMIETDDGDDGYFVGFESRICDYPARVPGQKKPSRTATGEDAEPACCGLALETLFAPADASRPLNLPLPVRE